jgi:hypothetical protein
MRGFRLGLRAVASAVYLECFDVQGVLDNERKNKWRLAVTDLALSLVPRGQDSATQLQEQATFMREYKSAFVNIDFQISSNSAFDEGNRSNSLILNVSKVHAVMQPTSVSEFGDFADHLQVSHTKISENHLMFFIGRDFEAARRTQGSSSRVQGKDTECP